MFKTLRRQSGKPTASPGPKLAASMPPPPPPPKPNPARPNSALIDRSVVFTNTEDDVVAGRAAAAIAERLKRFHDPVYRERAEQRERDERQRQQDKAEAERQAAADAYFAALRHEEEEREAARLHRQEAALREHLRRHFLGAGGTERDFARDYPTLRKRYLADEALASARSGRPPLDSEVARLASMPAYASRISPRPVSTTGDIAPIMPVRVRPN